MSMRKIRVPLVFLATFASLPPCGADDSARCYGIRDPDRRQACLAETRDAKSHCYAIKDTDRRHLCLAQTTGERSRCYNIRDRDLRASCLAGMGW